MGRAHVGLLIMRQEEDELSAALQALQVEDGGHVAVEHVVVEQSPGDPSAGLGSPTSGEERGTNPVRVRENAAHLAGGVAVAAGMNAEAPRVLGICLFEGDGTPAGDMSAVPSDLGPCGTRQCQETEEAGSGRVQSASAPSRGEGYRLQGPLASTAVAGLEASLQLLRQAIVWPLQYAQEAAQLGLQWPRGILLHGPPGCGKTSLVRAIAAEAGAAVHLVSASSIFGPYQGAVLNLPWQD